MNNKLWLCCVVLWCLQACVGQGAASTPDVVPITKEPSHHLVFENEYVRVFKVEVAPHAETLYHKHDVDYVFVTLGDSDVDSVRVGEPPVRLQLKDGETRFTKGGFAHKAVNKSDKPFVNVTVELKKGATNSKVVMDYVTGDRDNFTIFAADNIICRRWRVPENTSTLKPVPQNFLVVAISPLDLWYPHLKPSNPKVQLHKGDAIWIAKDEMQINSPLTEPAIAVVCEFGNEDSVSDQNRAQPRAAVPHDSK